MGRGRGELILFVDDEQPVLDVGVKKFLIERGGYQVITARNGADAAAVFLPVPRRCASLSPTSTCPKWTAESGARPSRHQTPRFPYRHDGRRPGNRREIEGVCERVSSKAIRSPEPAGYRSPHPWEFGISFPRSRLKPDLPTQPPSWELKTGVPESRQTAAAHEGAPRNTPVEICALTKR